MITTEQFEVGKEDWLRLKNYQFNLIMFLNSKEFPQNKTKDFNKHQIKSDKILQEIKSMEILLNRI